MNCYAVNCDNRVIVDLKYELIKIQIYLFLFDECGHGPGAARFQFRKKKNEQKRNVVRNINHQPYNTRIIIAIE